MIIYFIVALGFVKDKNISEKELKERIIHLFKWTIIVHVSIFLTSIILYILLPTFLLATIIHVLLSCLLTYFILKYSVKKYECNREKNLSRNELVETPSEENKTIIYHVERYTFKWWLHKLLPWVVGFVIFWCESYIFFAPQFEGKSLGQNDIAQYSGMSADIRAHREATGEDPQWTGAMFSGMPAYMIDVEYPTQDVKQSASGVAKIFGDPMNMILFAMIFMMVAVVLMGVNPWIGIIAGLAYGLSTYFFLIIDAGHITKMWALVYAPPLVGAVWYALRKNVWVGSALAALFGSLELGANHPQITYYFLFACIALWISEFVFSLVERRFKRYMLATAMLLVAALLAVGSNFAPLYYAFEHKDSTSRGGSETVDAKAARQEKIEYNTMWSYGKAESFNMLVPNYMGSSSMDIDDRVTE